MDSKYFVKQPARTRQEADRDCKERTGIATNGEEGSMKEWGLRVQYNSQPHRTRKELPFQIDQFLKYFVGRGNHP